MRVLGVDPGLRVTGYGCVEGDGSRPSIVEAGVFRLSPPSGAETLSPRLAELDDDFRELLGRVRPDLVAVEGLFAHKLHPETSVKMAHARGVLLLAARRHGTRIVELKPAAVKKAMTGSGRATKAQMQGGVARAFGLSEAPEPADVADALAIAVCALTRAGSGIDALRALGQ